MITAKDLLIECIKAYGNSESIGEPLTLAFMDGIRIGKIDVTSATEKHNLKSCRVGNTIVIQDMALYDKVKKMDLTLGSGI